ncbi:MAG: undecaprenyldiphospho-muramoylpentapeptide beta-N-acetylglucosaminyltransferase [Atopobiaceae bacterium]|nr:undecaprenyldiphospho-muramoylpentapeptide beta-N-acetylglucosaminyltransferase [Atopobiaceae bacterium]
MADRMLDVAIAAGGTAGHINPALALAEELTARGHRVTFYGQATRLEAKLVPAAGYPFVPVDVSGFDRERPWTLVTALIKTMTARRALGKRFASTGAPDVAIGFGAYVELPLLNWCIKNSVPVLIHEQNSVVGLANRSLASKCASVCISFPAAADAFIRSGAEKERIVLTGNPVRSSVVTASREGGRASIGATDGSTVLLVFGGSLGAAHLNDAVAALKDELLSRPELIVVHSTGAGDFERVSTALALSPEERERYRVMPYIDNMGEMLAAADLVVSRAGASSLAEISAIGVPSILVPYPHATEDHQTTNASFLVDRGAALMIPDSELDDTRFHDMLVGLLDDSDTRSDMRERALASATAPAVSLLADEVEKAAS